MTVLWGREDQFWAFDSVLTTLYDRHVHLWFNAPTDDGDWSGALFFRDVMDQVELIYLFVKPEARGKGLGRLLLQKLDTDLCSRKNTCKLILEVKDRNQSAIKLYESFAMKLMRRIPRYYRSGEDALVYEKEYGAV